MATRPTWVEPSAMVKGVVVLRLVSPRQVAETRYTPGVMLAKV